MKRSTALIAYLSVGLHGLGFRASFLHGDIGDMVDTRYNIMINDLMIQIHAQIIIYGAENPGVSVKVKFLYIIAVIRH